MKKVALFLVLVLLVGTLTACGEEVDSADVDAARFVGDWKSTSVEGDNHDLYSFRLLPSGSAVLTTYTIIEEIVATDGRPKRGWQTGSLGSSRQSGVSFPG